MGGVEGARSHPVDPAEFAQLAVFVTACRRLRSREPTRANRRWVDQGTALLALTSALIGLVSATYGGYLNVRAARLNADAIARNTALELRIEHLEREVGYAEPPSVSHRTAEPPR